jgi:hypothetical protein
MVWVGGTAAHRDDEQQQTDRAAAKVERAGQNRQKQEMRNVPFVLDDQ